MNIESETRQAENSFHVLTGQSDVYCKHLPANMYLFGGDQGSNYVPKCFKNLYRLHDAHAILDLYKHM